MKKMLFLVMALVIGITANIQSVCSANMGGPGEKIRIMCYGDSNTWGFTQRPAVKRYPADVR